MNASLKIAVAAEFELCEKIAQCLQQRVLAVSCLTVVEIYPFGEEQSLRFNQRAVEQIALEQVDWSSFDYLLFAGEIMHATYLAQAAEAGCIVVDMQGVCAALSDVPLVVPTVNDEQLSELRQRHIVSLPDAQVTQLALAIAALVHNYALTQLTVTSLLPASYADSETVGRLAGQTVRLLNGLPIEEGQQRLAFDVFPAATANLPQQLQKIFPSLENLTFHAIRVPVFYGIAQQVTAHFAYTADYEEIMANWRHNGLIEYAETLITPVINGEQESDNTDIKLHISGLTTVESVVGNGVEFWSVADDQRFNLAFMAVKLIELIQAH